MHTTVYHWKESEVTEALRLLTLNHYNPCNVLHAMVNARDFLIDGESVLFRFSGCRKADICRIAYDAAEDLFNLEFMHTAVPGMPRRTVEDFKGLYNDQIKGVFQSFTGLQTSL